MPVHSKRRKGKQGGRTTPMPPSGSSSDALDTNHVVTMTSATAHREEDSDSMSLVLTSDKRRGVYECDYCHVDISQMPRIRCAVCPDFDLCLECFATTDHSAAVARLKAAATVHDALLNAGEAGGNNSNGSGGRAKLAAGFSVTAANHDETHGYRVCDSTRYPIFPSSRKVTTSFSRSASLAGDQIESIAEETKEQKGEEDAASVSAITDKNKAKVGEDAGFASAVDEKKAKDGEDAGLASAPDDDNKAKGEEDAVSASASTVDDKNKTKGEEDAASASAVDDENSAKGEKDAVSAYAGDRKNKAKGEGEEGDAASASAVDDKNNAKGEEDTVSASAVVDNNANVESVNPADKDMMDIESVNDKNSQSVKPIGAGKSKKEASAADAAFVSKEIMPDPNDAEGIDLDEGKLQSEVVMLSEDPKFMWTAEEDLRLLDAIVTCGLGNWADISEAIAGNGSSGKTPKRCMERYLDDFLGRYGHILPPYTIVDEDSEPDESNDGDTAPSKPSSDDEEVRFSKRRRLLTRSPSCLPAANYGSSSWSKRKTKVVPTESLPGYQEVWPLPYLPPVDGIEIGQEVGRDQIYKSEQSYVKLISGVTAEEAEKIRVEWRETKLNKPGGLTVLPPRPEDVAKMPGAELAGFMPRRGDFDIEWENEAEQALADMEFSPADLPQDRQLKLQVLAIYNSKLDEREKRKKFLLSRNLFDYKKNQLEEQKLPLDERDLVRRMRLFERFHTPDEHKLFIADLLKAKRLRKEIAKLQMYRRIGIRTLAEAEKYELEKNRRQFHKAAQLKKEADMAQAATQTTAAVREGAGSSDEEAGVSLWKKYRTGDRKIRKSINRSGSTAAAQEGIETMDASEVPDSKMAAAEYNEAEKVPTEGEADSQVIATSVLETSEPDGKSESVGKRQGSDLLSPKETALCQKLELHPSQYIEVKRALLTESLTRGLLDKESAVSSRRTIIKVDVKKRGDVIDFMVRAGWISSKLGEIARSLPPAAAE